MQQTHYDTLGVKPDATEDEIRKAYRKMARRHHPDMGSKDKTFPLIAHAYSVLIDPDKRREYDAGHDTNLDDLRPFVHDFFSDYVNALPVLRITMPISLKDALLGADLTVMVRVPQTPQADPDCQWCAGTGQRINHESGFPTIEQCSCKSTDNEDGMVDVELGMRVPEGAKNGDLITIENPENLPYRKVQITLSVTKDNVYTMQGGKPIYTLDISTLDLIAGVRKRIPFFEKWVNLDIPAGTSPYEKFTVTHPHYPGISVRVKINATTPILEPEQIDNLKELLQQPSSTMSK